MSAPSPIVVRFRAGLPDMPKHARLRAAIVEAVEAGELPLGTKMMGERDLAGALGLSLGTTQKALGRLMAEGFLIRRQGHGTFVGSVRRPVSGSWHYRFLADDGVTELPVFATVLARELLPDDGPWTQALGADAKGYVVIRRSLDVGGKFTCASALYLPASRFGRLLRMAGKRLADTNLKLLLESDFSSPTLQSEGIANVIPLDAVACRTMRLPPRSWGLRIRIVGRTFGRTPITFQEMLVPPTAHGLKLDFNPPSPDEPANR